MKKTVTVSMSILFAMAFCMLFIPSTNALASTSQYDASTFSAMTPTFTATTDSGGVRVSICNAFFVMNEDGSVSIKSLQGRTIDSLPASYMGRGMSYRIISQTELVAYRRYIPQISRADEFSHDYPRCVMKTITGGGVTGAITGGISGGIPGAMVGAFGGIVAGMVWGPIGCAIQ
ncbi:hypothetical protein KIH75_01525 [Bifidobacterium sp. 64T4]|uniref:hypothetical protein n=1 Tax=Bifidobacterium pongonis TaxID=2834432 RepID=UPI001C57A651|nr:hypothetical protein [Bifidobacterium pongonis]MBW3094051.1 hypothetical protein [Bifidobacterium pongonis]